MGERRSELRRRRSRKKKMTKLKIKLGSAKELRDREAILAKIHIQSPWWQEPVKA